MHLCADLLIAYSMIERQLLFAFRLRPALNNWVCEPVLGTAAGQEEEHLHLFSSLRLGLHPLLYDTIFSTVTADSSLNHSTSHCSFYNQTDQAWQRITGLLRSRQATGLTKYNCVLHRCVIPFGLLSPDPKMSGTLLNR